MKWWIVENYLVLDKIYKRKSLHINSICFVENFKRTIKMFFQLVVKNLSFLGISKTQSVRSHRIKILIGYLFLGISIVLHLKYLYSEANGFEEFTQSIFISSVTVITSWCFISLIYKSDELFEFIDEGESLFVVFRDSKYSESACVICKTEELCLPFTTFERNCFFSA